MEPRRIATPATRPTTHTTGNWARPARSVTRPEAGRPSLLITTLRHILSLGGTGRFPARNATQEVSTQERRKTAPHATRQTTGTTGSLVRIAPSVTGPAAGREPRWITTGPPSGSRVHMHGWAVPRVTEAAYTAARRRTARPVTESRVTMPERWALIVRRVTTPAAGCRHGTTGGTRSTHITRTLMVLAGPVTRTHCRRPVAAPATMARPTTTMMMMMMTMMTTTSWSSSTRPAATRLPAADT
jgi:hypothetical protein